MLRITLRNGSKVIVANDDDWRLFAGQIIASEVYLPKTKAWTFVHVKKGKPVECRI